jgi:hypothetical protein
MLRSRDSGSPPMIIPSDDEPPDPATLLSPDLGRKDVAASGHGAKVKANDQTPEILDRKHNYSEGSWRLADKIFVSVSVLLGLFLLWVADIFLFLTGASGVPSFPVCAMFQVFLGV